MRKLGHGQSVMFAAPPEIDDQIRSCSPYPLDPNDRIDAFDIQRWAMLQTCGDLERHVPNWIEQGIDHTRRVNAHRRFGKHMKVSSLRKVWLTPDARTLEEMYGVSSPTAPSRRGDVRQLAFVPTNVRDRLNLLGIKLNDPRVEEEQEREFSYEIEQEFEIERPPIWEPASHVVHMDVKSFIDTGFIPAESPAFTSLFHPSCSFSPSAVDGWPKKLFASVDFSRTLTKVVTNDRSYYMRPVNWVVTGQTGIRVVLSPYEANELLPAIRQRRAVTLHVYAPRVTKSMQSFSNLQFYSVPAQPNPSQPCQRSVIQIYLDIFAGQLYLLDYHEYAMLCALLGIYRLPTSLLEQGPLLLESDGFVKPEIRELLFQHHPGYAVCRFKSSPIPMLRDIIQGRRKGAQYSHTHIGQFLSGRNPTPNDF